MHGCLKNFQDMFFPEDLGLIRFWGTSSNGCYHGNVLNNFGVIQFDRLYCDFRDVPQLTHFGVIIQEKNSWCSTQLWVSLLVYSFTNKIGRF